MFKKLTIALFGACLMSQVFAAPSTCPSTDLIKSMFPSTTMVERNKDDGSYIVGQVANYNTNDILAFAVFDIPASNEADALAKAKQAIPTLTGAPIPVYVPANKVYACLYDISYHYHALAFTGFKTNNVAGVMKFPKM